LTPGTIVPIVVVVVALIIAVAGYILDRAA